MTDFMKPRILAVIHLPPPVHGTTMINSYVSESLVLKENFDLRVIPIRFVKEVSQSGRFAFSKILRTCCLFLKILKELLFFRPALVYMTPAPTGWAFYRDFLLVGIMKIFPVKVVLHMHGQGIQVASRVSFKRFLYRQFFHRTEVICVSERLFFDIQDVFFGTPHIVPNALPECKDPRGNQSGEGRKAAEPVRMLYLSNLTRGKGLIEFLDALQVLQDDRKAQFNVRIAGSPNDITREQLAECLRQRNLAESVEYVGPQYGEGKQHCFAWADLFVFPTKIDVFGMVLLEAMQYGLPVIASRMAAIPDVVIDGETGFLVEPGNVQDLADKMLMLIQRPDFREIMGNAGRTHYLKGFTTDRFERLLADVFSRILSYSGSVQPPGSGGGNDREEPAKRSVAVCKTI